jgi:hypothetical protein
MNDEQQKTVAQRINMRPFLVEHLNWVVEFMDEFSRENEVERLFLINEFRKLETKGCGVLLIGSEYEHERHYFNAETIIFATEKGANEEVREEINRIVGARKEGSQKLFAEILREVLNASRVRARMEMWNHHDRARTCVVDCIKEDLRRCHYFAIEDAIINLRIHAARCLLRDYENDEDDEEEDD